MRTIFLVVMALMFAVKSFGQIDKEYLQKGEQAPEIVSIDQFGKEIDSKEILKEKKILLLFYRGNWCPYCKKHLKKLQDNLQEFNEKEVYVIVVTPEKPEKIEETTDKIKSSFSILHDTDNAIMEAYKVAFEVNADNVTSYFNYTKNKIAAYNVENNFVLPVPATYLINKKGKIEFVHYNPDYQKRADFKKILSQL